MPDLEKAIKGLHECDLNGGKIGNCPYKDAIIERLKEKEDLGTELTNAVELIHKKNERIEELLKKQEPKPVKVVKNAYNEDFYFCPNCDRQFYGLYKRPSYCDRCGQAVKWDDD
jgi:hypothetical protein